MSTMSFDWRGETDRLLWRVSQRKAAFIKKYMHVRVEILLIDETEFCLCSMYYMGKWNYSFFIPKWPAFSLVHVSSLRLFWKDHLIHLRFRIVLREKTLQLCSMVNQLQFIQLSWIIGRITLVRVEVWRNADSESLDFSLLLSFVMNM